MDGDGYRKRATNQKMGRERERGRAYIVVVERKKKKKKKKRRMNILLKYLVK